MARSVPPDPRPPGDGPDGAPRAGTVGARAAAGSGGWRLLASGGIAPLGLVALVAPGERGLEPVASDDRVPFALLGRVGGVDERAEVEPG